MPLSRIKASYKPARISCQDKTGMAQTLAIMEITHFLGSLCLSWALPCPFVPHVPSGYNDYFCGIMKQSQLSKKCEEHTTCLGCTGRCSGARILFTFHFHPEAFYILLPQFHASHFAAAFCPALSWEPSLVLPAALSVSAIDCTCKDNTTGCTCKDNTTGCTCKDNSFCGKTQKNGILMRWPLLKS